ncbi:porin [Paludisphaera sp.]|uniref:OprO/OprP family phosphate-selective porin n=1 Tax=Paludisphaera sp. TaxID=2017432 RepID=UPI00301E4C7E
MSRRIVKAGLALVATLDAPARSQEPTPPPAVHADTPQRPGASIEGLADRLRAVEALNERLVERLERTRREGEAERRRHDEQMRLLLERIEDLSTRLPGAPSRPPGPGTLDGRISRTRRPQDGGSEVAGPVPEYETQPIGPEALPAEEAEAPGFLTPDAASLLEGPPEYNGPVPEYETQPIEPNPFRSGAPGLSTIAAPSRLPLESHFGPGFQFQTPDEEFLLQVHVQSQIEARVWGDPNGGAPFRDGFYLPRQRIFFNGRITRPIEYVFSLNRGFGELNILETFLNFHPDDRFQVRFGRYFTPLGYDQFAVRNLWLPTPERSLFTTNLGTNRQVGLMGWGFLFDKRLDYAAGVFTGPRNSFEDVNNAKDFMGYLNARPFQASERFPALRNWNVGGSVSHGRQDQPAVPLAFRVGATAPTNAPQADLAAAPFLRLNRDVMERGPRLLGSVHSAYFNKGLSVIGEWNYGHAGYASPVLGTSADVPISGFYVTGAYFLTGEHVDRRAMVAPLRPVTAAGDDRRRGIGAWELVGRYSRLSLGRQIFDAGLADPEVWSSGAATYEAGLNWYWNEHLKVYMFWLRGDFDDPVRYGALDSRDGVDMFWMRFQLYY